MPLSETSRIYLHILIDCENLVLAVMGRAVHLKTKGDKLYGIHSISRRFEKSIQNFGKETRREERGLDIEWRVMLTSSVGSSM